MVFVLDERLENDSVLVGEFPLCLLLMSRDASYPWCILVPKREALTELYQLNDSDMVQFMAESRHLSRVLMELFNGDKLNVAALGNVVAQLHVHHVVRYRHDPAWPGPIWGAKPPLMFDDGEMSNRIELLCGNLGEGFVPAR